MFICLAHRQTKKPAKSTTSSGAGELWRGTPTEQSYWYARTNPHFKWIAWATPWALEISHSVLKTFFQILEDLMETMRCMAMNDASARAADVYMQAVLFLSTVWHMTASPISVLRRTLVHWGTILICPSSNSCACGETGPPRTLIENNYDEEYDVN